MIVAIIPIYNEGRTIEKVLESTLPWADHRIVVDDGSTDDSSALVRAWAERRERGLRLLTLSKNQGMATALRVGLLCAREELAAGRLGVEDRVVLLDADDQYALADIAALCALARSSGADVLKIRRDFSHYPKIKRLGNRLMTLWASVMAGRRLWDVEAGLHVIRAGVVPLLMRYYWGCRYSCAQEIGILSVRLGFQFKDDVLQPIAYYRSRTRLIDAARNCFFGFLAAGRVLFHLEVKRPAPVLRRSPEDLRSL